MLVTVGITTIRKGHKVHRHINGWSACGSGRLIAPARPVAQGDQLCRKCARHLETRLSWEIDDMRRRKCLARAVMLEAFIDSAKSVSELSDRDAFFAELRTSLVKNWPQREPVKMSAGDDRYVDTLTLF
jgi:hypothetical protein